MRFIIDLDSLELIQAAADRRRVTQVEGKRGDDAPFEVIFVRSGVAEELATDSILTFCAKQDGNYDDNSVVQHSTFVLSGSGTTAVYEGSPSFSTVGLNALFLINDDESDDPAYVDLMAEFTWQVGAGAPTSIKTFRFRVHNDVYRGDETGPTDIVAGVPVNVVAGTAQVETATVVAASGCTSNGTCTLTFTSAAVTGSPLSVAVALTTAANTAALVAAALRAGLTANAAIAAKWTIGGSGADITATRIIASNGTHATNDATVNIAIPSGLGLTAAATSANTTAGVAGTAATAGRVGSMYVTTGYVYIVESVTSTVPLWKRWATSSF